MQDVTLAAHVTARLRQLAPLADTVLVGLSGGSDSVAALHLLLDADVRVVAGHFDHRLRPTSGADAAFVAELCRRRGVALRSGGADVAAVARERGWNVEDAGRRLRYAFLHRAAKELGAQVVVLAHTRDDQAETVLLQLLRGAAFLPGMAPRRGRVVRPLLDVTREELRLYLRAQGQAYREDESNHDVGRSRAWLRHVIVPQLEARMPGVGRRLAGTAGVQRDAEAALAAIARVRFGRSSLRQEALAAAPAGLQRSALAGLLEAAGVELSLPRLERIREQLGRSGPWRLDVGRGRVARVANGQVEIVRPLRPAAPLSVRSERDLPAGVDAGVLDAYPELVLRSRRPGDRIRLPGGRRLLSDVLIDRKIPREERDGVRVLASGSEVLWVESVATAAGLAVSGGGDTDEPPMARAVALAEEAAAAGELPVGAVVMSGGRIVGEGRNRTESDADPTAHAELVALRAAARAAADWRLAGATLYVTLEPCAMCLGAVLQTRLGRVVYGADNAREGALGGVVDLLAGNLKRRPEVRRGVLAGRSRELLQEFFHDRRAGSGSVPEHRD